MDPSARDTFLVDCATTHTILHDKKYFSNLTLVQSNVNTISTLADLIKALEELILFYLVALGSKLLMLFTLMHLIEIYLVSRIFAEMDIMLKL